MRAETPVSPPLASAPPASAAREAARAGVKKLLVVTDEMEVGGSQRQITHFLKNLDRTRWQPTLIYFRKRSFLVDELLAAGVEVIELPKRGRIDAAFAWSLARALRDGRYDVVHCFSFTAELWVRALLWTARDSAFVASVRGLCLDYSPTQWRFKRWILGRADAVVSNARAGAQETARRTGFPLERIEVIPNGIEPLAQPVDRDALRRQLGAIPGRSLGLFVGRLVVEKNLPLLLDALARIEPAQRPLFLLAGGGPLEAELRARSAALGLDADLRLLGERSDSRRLMAAADFLVLPSREEGLSNVLLEAMDAGCAALASDVGGNPEIVDDGRTGLLFRSGDAAQLAERIQRLACDATLRARLAAAASEQVRTQYRIDALVRRTEAVYAKIG